MTSQLQTHIIQTLGVVPTINVQDEIETRVKFLKDFLKASQTKGFVLGISGGQDSALAGKLAQIAVDQLNAEEAGLEWTPTLWGETSVEECQKNRKYQFLALLLPYGVQKDADEALIIAEDFIAADEFINFNIKPTVDAFTETFNSIHSADIAGIATLPDYHKGNVKARVRMTTQYAYAGDRKLLVIGTDHAAEAVSGFFTKHGDGAADILPLSGLNKRQGKQLLRALGAPQFVITKAPTADLLDKKVQQADETELGVTYDALDDYLEGKTVEDDVANKIEVRFLMTEHKRQAPVTIYDKWWK